MVSRIEAFYIMSAAAADLKVYANYLRFFLTLQHILFTVLLFSYVSHMWNFMEFTILCGVVERMPQAELTGFDFYK